MAKKSFFMFYPLWGRQSQTSLKRFYHVLKELLRISGENTLKLETRPNTSKLSTDTVRTQVRARMAADSSVPMVEHAAPDHVAPEHMLRCLVFRGIWLLTAAQNGQRLEDRNHLLGPPFQKETDTYKLTFFWGN